MVHMEIRSVTFCVLSMVWIDGNNSIQCHSLCVADIRGGRDKDDSSSVQLDHSLTQRHTPHPHCSGGLDGG